MLEQILHCRAVAIGAAPFWKERRDRLVESKMTAAGELHDDARRDDRFRERGEVERRTNSCRRRCVVEGQLAERLLPERSAARADIDGCGGKRGCGDRVG